MQPLYYIACVFLGIIVCIAAEDETSGDELQTCQLETLVGQLSTLAANIRGEVTQVCSLTLYYLITT